MGIFEQEEISLGAALKALSVLDAVARAVADRSLLTESIKAAEVAAAERSAADISIEESKVAKAEAEKAIARSEAASGHLQDFRTRTDRECGQRRLDLDSNEKLIRGREIAVGEREEAIAKREAEHERELERLRAHVGSRAA